MQRGKKKQTISFAVGFPWVLFVRISTVSEVVPPALSAVMERKDGWFSSARDVCFESRM